jgi:hypothetical protein
MLVEVVRLGVMLESEAEGGGLGPGSLEAGEGSCSSFVGGQEIRVVWSTNT